MTFVINPRVLDELARIGAFSSPDKILAACEESVKRDDRLNSPNLNEWKRITSRLDDATVANIFRAVVVLEREGRWIGGSVASGVWLYRILMQRNYSECRQLADWSLAHRGNDWVPFGSATSASSIDEYEEEQRRRLERKRRASELRDAEQEAAKLRPAQRQAAHEDRRVKARERLAEINVALAEIYTVDASERLARILNSDIPLDLIPTDLLNAETLKASSRESLMELSNQIGLRRGDWSIVRQEIDRLLLCY